MVEGNGIIEKVYIVTMNCLTLILLALAIFLAAYSLYLLVLVRVV